jgi:hypothetical protein
MPAVTSHASGVGGVCGKRRKCVEDKNNHEKDTGYEKAYNWKGLSRQVRHPPYGMQASRGIEGKPSVGGTKQFEYRLKTGEKRENVDLPAPEIPKEISRGKM